MKPVLGNGYGPEDLSGSGQGVRIHEMDRQRTTSPYSPLENLGWPDLTLHLNYVRVAGSSYADPFFFLFERTHNYRAL